ncbi:MAG: tetratricopeptide repeat protein [Armatimonadota bacterium]|jgi:Flp pilus assembly protein TadD
MRTLGRKLSVPEVPEQLTDETAWAVYLPRRRTRRLYRVLALAIGVGAGLAYARFVADDPGRLWTVALAALGAVLGYVLVLMPAVLVNGSRKLLVSLGVKRRARALRRSIDRIIRKAERDLEKERDDRSAWERLGAASLLKGEEQRAVAAFEQVCEVSANGECNLNLAVALAETSEIDKAADLLLESAQSPDTARVAHHNLGVLLSRHPRQDVVDRILGDLDGFHAPAILSNVGAWELARGDLGLAERYLQRAVEEDPAAVAARANLGLVAYRRGELQEAVELLHEASYLDPMNPTLANDLGALLCAAGKPLVAARVLSRAALLAPASPEVEINRGCLRISLGQYEDALESFAEPLVRDRYPALAAHNGALALIALGRLEAAREEIEWGLERAPGDAGLLNNLGCLAWAERDDTAMVQIMSGLEESSDPGATLNIAAARIAAGRTTEALEMLEGLRERNIRDPLVSFYRGLAMLTEAIELYRPRMARRQRERFFEALHKCVRPFNAVVSSETAGSVEAQVNLALYRYLRLEFAAAADGFIAATKAFPQNGFAHYCAGTALAEEARRIQQESERGGELVGRARDLLKRARRHLETAIECDEVTADVFCNLGMCAYDLGDTESALNSFKRMVQLEDSADSNNNLAIVHAREGQQLQHSARAASLSSAERERDMLNRAGSHLSTALHYFLKALEHSRDDPVLHGNMGLAYMLRNRGDDVEAALRHWQRMLALGGASAGRRYEELTALAHGDESQRASFDEALMEFRSLDPRRCMMAPPPRLSGARQALQAIREETDWELLSDDPAVRDLLRQRDRLAGLEKRLARLSV